MHRAIADIERLQAEVAAERAQQQQQAQQMQRIMQADIDALHAALTDTETQRDAAIGRASLMKEQVKGSSSGPAVECLDFSFCESSIRGCYRL